MPMVEKRRFVLDPESGFVWDRSEEEWLTTVEEVFLAMDGNKLWTVPYRPGERIGNGTPRNSKNF